MNNFRIEFPNNLPSNYYISVDNKEMTFNKVKGGQDFYSFATEKEQVTVRIFNMYEGRFSAVGWFFITMIYWLLSGFGIFDFFTNKSCYRMDFKMDVTLKENTVFKLKLNLFKRDNPAIEIVENNAEHTVTENLFSIDKVAKRRKRLYNLFRVLFIVGAAIGAAFLIFNRP